MFHLIDMMQGCVWVRDSGRWPLTTVLTTLTRIHALLPTSIVKMFIDLPKAQSFTVQFIINDQLSSPIKSNGQHVAGKKYNPLMDILTFSWCKYVSLYNLFLFAIKRKLKGLMVNISFIIYKTNNHLLPHSMESKTIHDMHMYTDCNVRSWLLAIHLQI